MTYYEYFTFNVSAYLSSRFINKCPAVNGAAFAIKRETFEKIGGFHKVIAEDIDIGNTSFPSETAASPTPPMLKSKTSFFLIGANG